MKKTTLSLFILFAFFTLKAQILERLIHKPIDDAINDLNFLMKDEIKSNVRLVGIGDVADFVTEGQLLNTRLSAYLIKERKFRTVILGEDSWALRPLNSYLRSTTPLDTLKIDELMASSLVGHSLKTATFRDFLIWVKRFNLSNVSDMVNIIAVEPVIAIPPSYFLANYLFPIDEESAEKMAKKWSNLLNDDSAVYNDIQQWIKQLDYTKKTVAQKELIQACIQDLAHNKNIAKMDYPGQKKSVQSIQNHFNYTTTKIFNIVTDHTKSGSIYYGTNQVMTRSNMQSDQLIENTSVTTRGKMLYQKLKNEYYVTAIDFLDTATIFSANLDTQALELSSMQNNSGTRRLFYKSGVYLRSQATKQFAEYLPSTISFIKNTQTILHYTSGLPPVDAVFLFDKLTQDNPLIDKE